MPSVKFVIMCLYNRPLSYDCVHCSKADIKPVEDVTLLSQQYGVEDSCIEYGGGATSTWVKNPHQAALQIHPVVFEIDVHGEDGSDNNGRFSHEGKDFSKLDVDYVLDDINEERVDDKNDYAPSVENPSRGIVIRNDLGVHIDWDATYNELQGWIAAIREYIARTIVKLQTLPYYDQDDQYLGKRTLHQMFWTFNPCIWAFPHCKSFVQVLVKEEETGDDVIFVEDLVLHMWRDYHEFATILVGQPIPHVSLLVVHQESEIRQT
ncbi:hypothetical protein J1N35_041305 [Gossypium stocksii]|uniref:Uncharacterized protein n=1 Tax=Gossypium stocksii TaxID=47602 RepID=A0A9D3UFK6_9ROSI|nr:hypothetical protein J1N35_041305 [Gossypium stocksii]